MANYYDAGNITGFTELFQYANYVSGNYMGKLWIVGFFFIVMVIMSQRYDTKSAFVTAGFLSAVFAIFFRVIGIVNNFDVFFAIVVALIAMAVSMKSQY